MADDNKDQDTGSLQSQAKDPPAHMTLRNGKFVPTPPSNRGKGNKHQYKHRRSVTAPATGLQPGSSGLQRRDEMSDYESCNNTTGGTDLGEETIRVSGKDHSFDRASILGGKRLSGRANDNLNANENDAKHPTDPKYSSNVENKNFFGTKSRAPPGFMTSQSSRYEGLGAAAAATASYYQKQPREHQFKPAAAGTLAAARFRC